MSDAHLHAVDRHLRDAAPPRHRNHSSNVVRLPARSCHAEERSERAFALSSQFEDVQPTMRPPPKVPTQPRADGIQSGVFVWPIVSGLVIALLAFVVLGYGLGEALQFLRMLRVFG